MEWPPQVTMPSANVTDAPWPKNSAMRVRMASQAARTAMPLRSDPEEAAVAEVFGTFAVSVAVILTVSVETPNRAAATWAIFWNRP